MVKMKGLVCCKDVLHTVSKDIAVQSRQKEVEAAEEIVKNILSFLGVNHPESDCGQILGGSIVTGKYLMHCGTGLPWSKLGAWECWSNMLV